MEKLFEKEYRVSDLTHPETRREIAEHATIAMGLGRKMELSTSTREVGGGERLAGYDYHGSGIREKTPVSNCQYMSISY